ncbi:MAG: alpha-glucosidase/alpha-galactosidase [Firmicutes bacterium]|nr:alpha-glucosidase/alpha-galactosidase [Bacillota bacterium]
MKVAIIGAGSVVFAKTLIYDILSFPELSGCTISLMDIDAGRLERIAKIARMMVEREGLAAEIEPTMDRRKALEKADYVIAMFKIGGLEAYRLDQEIPARYGLDQAVGDTLGPGGVFRALRTIPVLLAICREMEELCPEALLLNYVNPMAMNIWAIYRKSGIAHVGLCHSVQGTAADIARYIGAPLDEVSYTCAGINHRGWFLEYKWKGRDAYPLLRERCHDPAVYRQDIIKFEVLKHFGYFVTESSYHMSEYLPYFRTRTDCLAKIKEIDSGLKNDEGNYYIHCINREKEEFQRIERQIREEENLELKKSHEYGAYIIHSIETGTPRVIYGNVKNTGLITNLPTGCCVEVPILVDENGLSPCYIGDLPMQLAALNRTNVNVQELAVEAALTGNKDAVYQAVMLDPLTSAVLTMDEIHRLVSELFAAEADYLPQFK